MAKAQSAPRQAMQDQAWPSPLLLKEVCLSIRPKLNDRVVLLQGPDRGSVGTVVAEKTSPWPLQVKQESSSTSMLTNGWYALHEVMLIPEGKAIPALPPPALSWLPAGRKKEIGFFEVIKKGRNLGKVGMVSSDDMQMCRRKEKKILRLLMADGMEEPFEASELSPISLSILVESWRNEGRPTVGDYFEIVGPDVRYWYATHAFPELVGRVGVIVHDEVLQTRIDDHELPLSFIPRMSYNVGMFKARNMYKVRLFADEEGWLERANIRRITYKEFKRKQMAEYDKILKMGPYEPPDPKLQYQPKEGAQEVRKEEQLSPVLYKAIAFKTLQMVQIYAVHSHAHEYYQILVYCSKPELANVLLPMPPAKLRHFLDGRAIVPPSVAIKRLPGKLTGRELWPPRAQKISTRFLCQRAAHEPEETYVDRKFLAGILPAVLVDDYLFFKEDSSSSATANETRVMIRGYPKVEDPSKRHVLLLCVCPENLPFDDEPHWCATVHKHFLDGSGEDLALMNVLAAASASGRAKASFETLMQLIIRLESLPNTLVWATLPDNNEAAEDYASKEDWLGTMIAELPRLSMNLRSRVVHDSGRMETRLYSVEHPHLHVYRPPGGVWDKAVLRLSETTPHGVLMVSETQQLYLLVPNVQMGLSSERGLFVDRSGSHKWDENVATPYFMYEVSVTKQFLVATGFTATLYLCVLRFLACDYVECFSVASVLTETRQLSREEEQILELLALVSIPAHPDAHACACKIALMLEEAGNPLPASLSDHGLQYFTRRSHVQVSCRLSHLHELRLIDHIHTEGSGASTSSGEDHTDGQTTLGDIPEEVRVALANQKTYLEWLQERRAADASNHLYNVLSVDKQSDLGDVYCCNPGELRAKLRTSTKQWRDLVLEYGLNAHDAPLLRNGDKLEIQPHEVRHIASKRRLLRCEPNLFRKGDPIRLDRRSVIHLPTGHSVPRTEPVVGYFRTSDPIQLEWDMVTHLTHNISVKRKDVLFRTGDTIKLVPGRGVLHVATGRTVPMAFQWGAVIMQQDIRASDVKPPLKGNAVLLSAVFHPGDPAHVFVMSRHENQNESGHHNGSAFCVHKVAVDGTVIQQFGADTLKSPSSMAVGESILITDEDAACVWMFSLSGELLRSFALPHEADTVIGSATEEAAAAGPQTVLLKIKHGVRKLSAGPICISLSQSEAFVLDSVRKRISVFSTHDGTFCRSFTPSAAPATATDKEASLGKVGNSGVLPIAIAVDAGRIYVLMAVASVGEWASDGDDLIEDHSSKIEVFDIMGAYQHSLSYQADSEASASTICASAGVLFLGDPDMEQVIMLSTQGEKLGYLLTNQEQHAQNISVAADGFVVVSNLGRGNISIEKASSNPGLQSISIFKLDALAMAQKGLNPATNFDCRHVSADLAQLEVVLTGLEMTDNEVIDLANQGRSQKVVHVKFRNVLNVTMGTLSLTLKDVTSHAQEDEDGSFVLPQVFIDPLPDGDTDLEDRDSDLESIRIDSGSDSSDTDFKGANGDDSNGVKEPTELSKTAQWKAQALKMAAEKTQALDKATQRLLVLESASDTAERESRKMEAKLCTAGRPHNLDEDGTLMRARIAEDAAVAAVDAKVAEIAWLQASVKVLEARAALCDAKANSKAQAAAIKATETELEHASEALKKASEELRAHQMDANVGVSWEALGARRPSDGTQLEGHALSEAIKAKIVAKEADDDKPIQFTLTELDAVLKAEEASLPLRAAHQSLPFTDLSFKDQYVLVDDVYYRALCADNSDDELVSDDESEAGSRPHGIGSVMLAASISMLDSVSAAVDPRKAQGRQLKRSVRRAERACRSTGKKLQNLVNKAEGEKPELVELGNECSKAKRAESEAKSVKRTKAALLKRLNSGCPLTQTCVFENPLNTYTANDVEMTLTSIEGAHVGYSCYRSGTFPITGNRYHLREPVGLLWAVHHNRPLLGRQLDHDALKNALKEKLECKLESSSLMAEVNKPIHFTRAELDATHLADLSVQDYVQVDDMYCTALAGDNHMFDEYGGYDLCEAEFQKLQSKDEQQQYECIPPPTPLTIDLRAATEHPCAVTFEQCSPALFRPGDTVRIIGGDVVHVAKGTQRPRKDIEHVAIAEEHVIKEPLCELGDEIVIRSEGRTFVFDACIMDRSTFDGNIGQQVTLAGVRVTVNEVVNLEFQALPPAPGIQVANVQASLFKNGDDLSLEAHDVVHLRSGTLVPRSDEVDVLFKEGNEVKIEGGFAVHTASGRRVPLEIDPLFCDDDEVRFVGMYAIHVATGRKIMRADLASFAEGDKVELWNDNVLNIRTDISTTRTDDGRGSFTVHKLHGILGIVGETIDLIRQGDPPINCTFENTVNEVAPAGEGQVVTLRDLASQPADRAGDLVHVEIDDSGQQASFFNPRTLASGETVILPPLHADARKPGGIIAVEYGQQSSAEHGLTQKKHVVRFRNVVHTGIHGRGQIVKLTGLREIPGEVVTLPALETPVGPDMFNAVEAEGKSFVTKISFQAAGTPVPVAHMVDCGAAFGLRSTGLRHGWSYDLSTCCQTATTDHPLLRNYLSADKAVAATDGTGDQGAAWFLQVPSGSYTVVLGFHGGSSGCPLMVNGSAITRDELIESSLAIKHDVLVAADETFRGADRVLLVQKQVINLRTGRVVSRTDDGEGSGEHVVLKGINAIEGAFIECVHGRSSQACGEPSPCFRLSFPCVIM